MKKAKKSIPDLLSEAFETQNWSLVNTAYSLLTGNSLFEEESEEVVEKPKLKPKAKTKPKKIAKIASKPKKKISIAANPVTQNQGAPIGQLREMVFYNEGTTAKGKKLAQAVLKKAKKNNMPPRPDYKPNMCNCSICGKSFDYNKEYPAGQFGDRNILKCNKCKGVSK